MLTGVDSLRSRLIQQLSKREREAMLLVLKRFSGGMSFLTENNFFPAVFVWGLRLGDREDS